MSNYQVQIKALIQANELQRALNEAAKSVTLNIPSLKMTFSGAENFSKELKSAANATSDLGKEAAGATTKIQQTFKVAADGSKELRNQTETVNIGFKETAQLLSSVNQKTKELELNTIKTTQDKLGAQKEYQKYLQQEQEIDRKIELERTRAYELHLKQQSQAVTEEQRLIDHRIRNQQTIQALELRLQGLTNTQKQLIQTQLEGITVEQKLNEIRAMTDIHAQTQALAGFKSQISSVVYGITNFAASIEYMMQRFLQIGVVMLALRKAKQLISDMITVVKDLDTSLVELKKVTDLSGSSLETFTAQAYSVGQQIARTGKEVIDATTIFSRSGYEIREALDLAETSLILLNVGDGISNIEEAATSLISVLKGFNMEASQATEIIDKINQISNTSAINFADLTEGLTRTSATFSAAGVEISELSALLTGANEILQNIKTKIRYFSYSAYVQKCA